MKKIKAIEVAPEMKRRLKDAEKDYLKILEEILPFVKKRKLKRPSTNGKWVSSRVDGA
jgi:hypothetical protein